jgi:serine-type D-Ala-D-Ala endopeptidase (penicillin-binding protein 7)
MHLFSILISFISVTVSGLPVVENNGYISNNTIRADRAIEVEAKFSPPTKQDVKSLGPSISAKSAVVVDAESGAILYTKESNIVWPMASIVKLMSALVFLEADVVLEERVKMEAQDMREGGERIINVNETATLRDYLTASLLGSANNATIVLSRSAGMSIQEFVDRMNNKAKELGMDNTNFVEPSGLDPENVSTSVDIVKLLAHANKSKVIKEIIGTHIGSVQVFPSGIRRTVLGTNHLMGSIVYVVFGKTGYLDESLYNLATTVSTKNNHELYIVTFGSTTNTNRVQDAKNLAVWAEKVYKWKN